MPGEEVTIGMAVVIVVPPCTMVDKSVTVSIAVPELCVTVSTRVSVDGTRIVVVAEEVSGA